MYPHFFVDLGMCNKNETDFKTTEKLDLYLRRYFRDFQKPMHMVDFRRKISDISNGTSNNQHKILSQHEECRERYENIVKLGSYE